MSVKMNVTALTRVADRQAKAAAKAEAGTAAVVAKNAELLARVARAEVPVSDGSRGGDVHLRDTIGWAMFGVGGTAAALIGPEGEYGERIGAFTEFGTPRHDIPPRADGPGYLAWGPRARVAPDAKQWKSSHHYGDGSGRLPIVDHPGTDPNPFMMRALGVVLPKFQRDVEDLGKKSI